jgi:hypothetical protein
MPLLSEQELRFCRKPKEAAQREDTREAWSDFVRQSDELLFGEFDQWALKGAPPTLLLPFVDAMTRILRRLPAAFPECRDDRLLRERLENLIKAATRLANKPPRKDGGEETAEAFRRLSAPWRRETRFLSSVTDMSMHSAYQRIIGLGPAAIPLILRELQRSPDHWFWALDMITGAKLEIPPEIEGNMKAVAEVWLRWGRENGYIQ